MLPSKRGADDLITRSSADNKRTCSGQEAIDDLLISDIWSELSEEVASNLSRSVVSIALSDGQSVLYASSGIVIEQCNFTKFVTSASLVRALHDSKANGHDKLEIEVRHEGNVAIGVLEEYDLDYQIAVLKVMSVLDVYCIPLNYLVQFGPHCTKVVAVGCDISGRVLATSGTCTDSRGSQYSRYIMFSTCKLSKTMQGGALFDFHGNFFGMNPFWDMERPIFLPRSIILERLGHFHTSSKKTVFLNLVKPIRDKRKRRRIGVKLFPHPGGSIKIFGDIYPNGVWDELKEGVARHICGNLVALASFHGGSKLFACTGFFIDYYADKCPAILTSASLVRNRDGTIIEGLTIEVLLPNNERCEGKLEHYSLHYNVALLSVKNYNVDCPVNLKHQTVDYSKVVAVGRCFEPDLVMASGGQCVRWLGKLRCDDLWYTTCTITKAGIGGPLVDVNGNFIGMNYYDRNMGTPYLRFDLLCGIVNYFKTGRTNYEEIDRHSLSPFPESHIVEDGKKQPPNRWMCAGQSEDMETLVDQDEDAANEERAAITKPNRYWFRNGNFSVYK